MSEVERICLLRCTLFQKRYRLSAEKKEICCVMYVCMLRVTQNSTTSQIGSAVKQFGNHQMCAARDSVQSVRTSKSKHVSAERKSLHNGVSQPHAILYKHSGAPSGGPAFSSSERARPLCHWLRFGRREPVISALPSRPTTNQTLCCLASLICFCLSGHLDTHLASQGARQMDRWTRQ